jgi:hypothetical protein
MGFIKINSLTNINNSKEKVDKNKFIHRIKITYDRNEGIKRFLIAVMIKLLKF